MKTIISAILIISLMTMTGCAARGSSGKRDNTQELRKSPCAFLTVETQDVTV